MSDRILSIKPTNEEKEASFRELKQQMEAGAPELEEYRPDGIYGPEGLWAIANANGCLCISSVAMCLNISPRHLFARLAQTGWIYRRDGTGKYVGHDDKVDAGFLENHISKIIVRTDGSTLILGQVRVTGRGFDALRPLVGGLRLLCDRRQGAH